MSPAFSASFLAFLALFQAKQTPTQATVEGATLEGRVLKAGTDEPLKKASLTLRNVGGEGRPQTTSTDVGGRFVLKDIAPGRYMLWAERNGYVRQAYGQRGNDRFGITLSLAAGQSLSDLTFRLIPAAVIAGRVTDEDGEPIAGAIVHVAQYRFREGKRDLVLAGMGDRTDDLGEYRIHGLAPGQYFISATPAREWGGSPAAMVQEAGGKSEESYPPVYYPGTSDPARATPVEVRAGEVASAIDISLMPARAVRVRGRVFNAITGQPGRGMSVYLRARGSSMSGFQGRGTYVDDPQGTFEIVGVTPGSYFLEAAWWSEGTENSVRIPLEVGTADVDGISVVLTVPARIPGRVRVEGDAPVTLSGLQVFLAPSEWGMGPGGLEVTVKPEGTFVFPSVSDGEYRIEIWELPEDCYIKSARLAGESVLETGLRVSSGQVGGSLEIVVSSAGGRAEGIVTRDGQPFSGAHVVLAPEGSKRNQMRLFKQANTDQYGRFQVRGIVPGDYRLFAWEELEPGAYQDPEFLKRFEDQGEPVRIEENGRVTAQLKLIPGEAKAP
ncbi:MAG: carboxypeptidase regulatory-like domain-containing protein [Terriglobia bacterium]